MKTKTAAADLDIDILKIAEGEDDDDSKGKKKEESSSESPEQETEAAPFDSDSDDDKAPPAGESSKSDSKSDKSEKSDEPEVKAEDAPPPLPPPPPAEESSKSEKSDSKGAKGDDEDEEKEQSYTGPAAAPYSGKPETDPNTMVPPHATPGDPSSSDSSYTGNETALPGGGVPESATTPTPVEAEVDEMIIHPIADTVDERTARVEMYLFPDDKNPSWIVFANGDPMAKICLGDQENPDLIRQAFVLDSYAEHVMENIKRVGMVPVLSGVKARFYHAQIYRSDMAKKLTKAIKERVEKRVAAANDKYNERVVNLMNLVVQAAAKNFFKEPDQFKLAMVQELRRQGINDPVPVVEKLFLDHSQPWFQSIMTKAAEWSSYTDEAMQQIRASVEDMGQRTANYEAVEARESARTAAAARTAPMANVPLTTHGTQSRALSTPTGMARQIEAGAEQDQVRDHYRSLMRGIRRR